METYEDDFLNQSSGDLNPEDYNDYFAFGSPRLSSTSN